MTAVRRVLVLGYGNPSRQDDGLGPALAQAIGRLRIPGVTSETRYQLQIEEAAEVAYYDAVVFADATRDGDDPFSLSRIAPRDAPTFTTHSVAPHTVLALARSHFDCRADGYLLAIRGQDFDDFGQALSRAAARNLDLAVDHLERALRAGLPGTRVVSEVTS